MFLAGAREACCSRPALLCELRRSAERLESAVAVSGVCCMLGYERRSSGSGALPTPRDAGAVIYGGRHRQLHVQDQLHCSSPRRGGRSSLPVRRDRRSAPASGRGLRLVRLTRLMSAPAGSLGELEVSYAGARGSSPPATSCTVSFCTRCGRRHLPARGAPDLPATPAIPRSVTRRAIVGLAPF